MNKNGSPQITSNDSEHPRLSDPKETQVDLQKGASLQHISRFFEKALDAVPPGARVFVALFFVLVVALIVTLGNTSRNLGLILIGISVVMFGVLVWHLRYTELKLKHTEVKLRLTELQLKNERETVDEIKKALRQVVQEQFERERKRNMRKAASATGSR